MKTEREFATRIAYAKFLEGVKETIDKGILRKVKLLRLSVKTDRKGKKSIDSIWGFVNRRLMVKFIVKLPDVNEELTSDDWNKYGSDSGKYFNEWYSSDQELDTLDRKFAAIRFNVWETSSDWDLAQDIIDDVEYEFSTHINGKFHWRVRKALTDAIANLSEKSRKNFEKCLSDKENIDLLKEIIEKSPITLKTTSKNKVTSGA
jgi:hypothetical protein